MYEFLTWLDGKKTIILGISQAINTYLMAANIISGDMGAMIASIIGILAGGAVYATNQTLGRSVRVKE